MNEKYYCKCCNYDAKQKCNYEKHLKTKKHLKSTKSQQKVNIQSTKSQHFFSNFECKYCNKNFTTRQSMYRHIKYTCKQNKDEDLKELVRLLNEQNQELKQELKQQQDNMQKQIDKLTKKLQIQKIGTQNNNSHNHTINYTINNYIDTDYSHLTDRDYIKCIKDTNHCVKALIERVHLNEKKPTNMNIYIPSMKDSYIMMYKDNEWTIQDRKQILDDLYDRNEYELEAWYDEFHEKYPEIIKSFKKYLENKKEDDEIVSDIKRKVLMEFYNKRNMVLQNKTIANVSFTE